MSKKVSGIIKPIVFSVVTMLLVGVIYPLAMMGIGQLAFHDQVNGSLISVDGQVIGSKLIGQEFTDPRFMQGRPSAVGYNVYTPEDVANGDFEMAGTGSDNYSLANPDMLERVQNDLEAFLQRNPTVSPEDIPADLLTASGSGLDPHISPQSAEIQLPAIAEATGLSMDQLHSIVADNTAHPLLGIFGTEHVNVLGVNIGIAQALGLIGDLD